MMRRGAVFGRRREKNTNREIRDVSNLNLTWHLEISSRILHVGFSLILFDVDSPIFLILYDDVVVLQ